MKQKLSAGGLNMERFRFLLKGLVLAGLVGCATPPANYENADLDQLDNSLRIAAAAVEAGQFDAAKRLYHQLQSNFPDSAEPYLGMANIAFAEGNMEIAGRAFGDAVIRARTKEHQAEAELGQGRVALLLGDPNAARMHFAVAEKHQPISAWAANGLGSAATLQNDHEAATAHYRRAQALEPGNPRIDANLVRSLLKQDQVTQADALYRSKENDYWLPEDRDSLADLIEERISALETSSQPTSPGKDGPTPDDHSESEVVSRDVNSPSQFDPVWASAPSSAQPFGGHAEAGASVELSSYNQFMVEMAWELAKPVVQVLSHQLANRQIDSDYYHNKIGNELSRCWETVNRIFPNNGGGAKIGQTSLISTGHPLLDDR